MISELRSAPTVALPGWQMPIIPEQYDRSPLSSEELWAFKEYARLCSLHKTSTSESVACRNIISRLSAPIVDVFRLRHGNNSLDLLRKVQQIIRCEMLCRRKSFWEWSLTEWLEIICPTEILFVKKFGPIGGARRAIMDCAYLLAEISDLRAVGMHIHAVDRAYVYFGQDLVDQQFQRALSLLQSKGYGHKAARSGGKHFYLKQYFAVLFLLNRCPSLKSATQEHLAIVNEISPDLYAVRRSALIVLQELGIIPIDVKEVVDQTTFSFNNEGVAPEWYQWCMAWYEQEADLTPGVRKHYLDRLLGVGRWLDKHAPTIRSPEQWTEDLALRFRADLCTWKSGQYTSVSGQTILANKKSLGKPLKATSIAYYLTVPRRFFTDLTQKAHTINGTVRKIKLDFHPNDVFKTPKHIAQAVERAEPRDIDLRIWAKLAIAAATLSQSDLPRHAWQPLSLYRALGLLWVTSARRPNELTRLKFDCLREDWEPSMLDEEGHPLEKIIASKVEHQQTDTQKKGDYPPKIFYLHIPFSKDRGPFWIWIPDYTADALKAWKLERPPNQRKLWDSKENEYIDYLFCFKEKHIGPTFINKS